MRNRSLAGRATVGIAALTALGLAGPLAAEPAPFSAAARWIWDGGPAQPVDAYRLFRRSFWVARLPRRAPLKITADSEYRLFVNGQYAGRGPAPNPPSHASVDTIDVGPLLREGRNAIGVIVYHLGVPSFPRQMGRAGLIAELIAPGLRIGTDSSWRWHDAWWVPSGQRYSIFREFTEIQDAAQMRALWAIPEIIEDRTWSPAVEIGPANTPPWTTPEPRDIPLADHRTVYPEKVLFASLTTADSFDVKSASQVLARAPETTVAPGKTSPLRDLMTHREPWFEVDATERPVVIGLDFGREVSGFPEISVQTVSGEPILDLGYGEGLEKDGRFSIRRQGNPSCDRLIPAGGEDTFRIFHHRAFRYMALSVQRGKVRIGTPALVESGYPVQNRGSFACSDSMLTRIWQVGKHTMRICMDQGFMDCPWRERGQYIGDGLAEGPVALYAFGDTKLMRRFLRQGALCQPADGLLEPAYPSDWTAFHGSRGPNRIPGYGLLWIVMLDQYYRDTGDLALLRELEPAMTRLLAWFNPHRGPDGQLASIPEWNFIDWAKMDKRSEMACLNLQYLMALRSASAIERALGRKTRLDDEAAALVHAFDAAHWDGQRGLFRDAPGLYTKHTNALALLTVVEQGDARAPRIIAQLGAPDLLQPESPYFEGYVLRALVKHGRLDLALNTIHYKWGPMIDAGATTFWESYGGQWSLCHAWSCTPTALLSEAVLGVTYSAPDRALQIALPSPKLTGGVTHAEGAAPLACGDVGVKWTVESASIRAVVTVPRGASAAIIPPPGWRIVRVDGHPRNGPAGSGTKLGAGRHVVQLAEAPGRAAAAPIAPSGR